MKSHSEQLEELQNLRQQVSREQAFLKEQQAYNESAPLELKIAVAHMEQAKRDKLAVELELEALRHDVNVSREELEKVKRDIERAKNQYESDIKEDDNKIKARKHDYDLLVINLRVINEDIKSRKHYLEEQEAVIIDTTEKGQESFDQLANRYSQLERSVNSKEVEKIRLGNDIASLIVDSEKLDREFSDKIINNESEIEKATKELHKVQAKVQEAQAQYELVNKAVDDRKNELRGEVERIDAKLAQLHAESKELQVAKRRYSPNDIIGL